MAKKLAFNYRYAIYSNDYGIKLYLILNVWYIQIVYDLNSL